MLKLRDFFHLPQLDPLFNQILSREPGIAIVSGLDPRPALSHAGDIFLPSGRNTIFNIVIQDLLATHANIKATFIAKDKSVARVDRQFKRRISLVQVEPSHTYTQRISEAIPRKPDLLVIDNLDSDNVLAAFDASERGILVLSQLDTLFCGSETIRLLRELGLPREKFRNLKWIFSVHRFSTLCPKCKQITTPTREQLNRLLWLHSQPAADLNNLIEEIFDGDPESLVIKPGVSLYQAKGCPHCRFKGRSGDIAAFDVFQADHKTIDLEEQSSQLALKEYILQLACLGYLPIEDFLKWETDQLHRTFHLLTATERALAESARNLKRKQVELEAANKVLQQRTEVLMSLQEIVQLLITSNKMSDLAVRVCRRASALCSADRSILYLRKTSGGKEGQVEVLAVGGWDDNLLHSRMEASEVFLPVEAPEPTVYRGLPPGIPASMLNIPGGNEKIVLKAGLRLPLIAQDGLVGLMIVHSTQKEVFLPGEVALLKTFANQAAVAIQRAGLIEELQEKIFQLEAAQVELVKKERLERELEIARQVQQSMLPHTFPAIPGFAFAARNEPARQVGGDYYDVVDLDARHFGVIIADVSDKGMPAALFMALTRSLLLAEARRTLSPSAVLTNVNDLLMELGEPRQFVSVFYGVMDKITCQLTYSRAGHERPLWIHKGKIEPLGGEGTILGVLNQDELILSEEKITLDHGDRLVLFTDGLTDTKNRKGEFYDARRLSELMQSLARVPVNEMCAATFAELNRYQGEGEQYDDMTLLVVEIE